ncbi:hypothetical protein [Streptomyces indicus]|nr:hypothetical protein [Streptomyces indicus]
MALAPAALAKLPDVALILALYASDYVMDRRRTESEKIAAFMVDGASRLGLVELIDQITLLTAHWNVCRHGHNDEDRWAAYADYKAQFDHPRIVHCCYVLGRAPKGIRRALATMTAEAVTA